MFIIPPTGIATLFIPIREMLMSIPPLQELKDKGVFDLYNSTFEFLGFTKTLKSYSYDYFKFQRLSYKSYNNFYLLNLDFRI